MTTAISFYPYYSRKPAAPQAVLAQMAGTQQSDELQAWKDVIRQVESSGAISESNGEFLVSQALLEQAVTHVMTRHAVLQAVAASNAVPAAPVPHAAALAGAKAAALDKPKKATIADIIEDILGVGADVPGIQQNVTDIAAGSKVLKKHWWGIELAFTQKAAAALGALLGKNLGGVTTLLSALATAIPALAVLTAVSAIASLVLKGVGAWVDAANQSGNGILLTVYAWIFPVFLSASAAVTVP